MPYCQKCGAEINEGAGFCHACGETVSDKQTSAHQVGTLTLKRLNALSASGVATKVKIDGLEHGALRINQEMSVNLPYGVHTVELKAALNPSVTFQITLKPEADNIIYPFKIGASGKAVYAGDTKSTTVTTSPSPTKKRHGCLTSLLVVFAVFLLVVDCKMKLDTWAKEGP